MIEFTPEVASPPLPYPTARQRAEEIGRLLTSNDVALIIRRGEGNQVTFHIVISEEPAPDAEQERSTQALYCMALGLLTYASKPGNTTEAFKLGARVLAANADIQKAIKDETNGRT
jgi:hypothetical protein